MSKLLFRKINTFYNEINSDQFTLNKSGFINWNSGIYGNKNDNAMPQFLIDLYTNCSSAHQNLVNLKSDLLRGNNLQVAEDYDPSSTARLEAFIRNRNKTGDNLKAVYAKACQDAALFNGCVLQLIYDKEGKIAEVYHVPLQDFRLAKPNKYGQVDWGYVSKGFAKLRGQNFNFKKDSTKLKMFSPTEWREYPVQLMYIKPYTYADYSIPIYMSAIPWLLLEREIADFHLNNVKSNMFLSGMLVQHKGGMTDAELDENAREIEELYKGKDGRKILLAYVEDMENEKPTFEKFVEDGQDKLFDLLLRTSNQSIITSHRAYPILAGIDEKGADLGGDSNKLNVAVGAFYSLVAHPLKEIILGYFNQIAEVNEFANFDVVTDPLKISLPEGQPEDTTRTERRAMLYDLPPLPEDVGDDDNNINDAANS